MYCGVANVKVGGNVIPIGKLGQMKPATPSPAPTIGDLLKSNLAVLATLIAFCGLVSTEAYYAGLGLRYQTLGLGAQHIAYRGVTALFGSAWLFAIYLVAFVWLATDKPLDRHFRWYSKAKLALSLVGIVLFTVAGYAAARASGLSQADEDLDPQTTKLVRIVNLIVDLKACETACDFAGYRLVHSDSDAFYIAKPSAEAKDATRPVVRRISKSSVQRLELSGV